MIAKKALLATAVMALASTPAWATPGYGHEPENGASHRSEAGSEHAKGGEHAGSNGNGHGHHSHPNNQGHKGNGSQGKSHKCKPHGVAYVAAGQLVKWTLTEEEGSKHHTYEGEVTVEVQRTNHHARADRGETVTYEVKQAHVHGSVSVEDLAEGDRVRVIGKITKLAKKCKAGEEEFMPTIDVHRLIFHAPRQTQTTTTTTTSTG